MTSGAPTRSPLRPTPPPARAPGPARVPGPGRASRIGWALFTLAELPLLGAVAIGWLARWLPPGPFWWAQLAAVGLPYLAWALAAVAVVPLLGRRWGLLTVHALLLALVLVRALDGGVAAEPSDTDLALTTFNLPQTGPTREGLVDSTEAFVERAHPDVLLMQDAWVYVDRTGSLLPEERQGPQTVGVQERLPYRIHVPRRLHGAMEPDRQGTGVPVFVRTDGPAEVVDQEALNLRATEGIDPGASIALRTRLRWDGRDLVVYNVHLRSFGGDKPWQDSTVVWTRPRTWLPYLRLYRRVYRQRAAEVDRLAERIAAETLPVVVAGDFNSTADNWSYWRLRTAGGVDRTDAYREAGGRAWGRTYHAARPLVRIDYVLADPALAVTAASVGDVAFSDHRPVSVRLRWRDGE